MQNRRVELAPVTPVTGTWMTPVTRDPLEVPLEDKVALLLAANEAALKVTGVRFVNSGLSLLREVKTLLTTEGTNVTQTFFRVGPSFSATAIATAIQAQGRTRKARRSPALGPGSGVYGSEGGAGWRGTSSSPSRT